MTRLTPRAYTRRLLALMTVYVALMLLAWPYAKSASSMPLRTVFALLPALPMFGVIALMARRVIGSDELEQRVHMGALGISTAIVCMASLVGGFLAAAHVVALEGDVLIWIVPLVSVSYSAAYWWLGRRYGGLGCE